MQNLEYFRDRNPDYVTIPQHFKTSGFASQGCGKVFHPIENE
jgi:hypothetical protein